jgi:4-hydroxy-3-methylbut-2-enyl diphosphate reductase
VLYDICKETNPRTYFVEDETELQPEWFADARAVGISGATSTPQWLMERVRTVVESIPTAE